jgi:hypothetical protein
MHARVLFTALALRLSALNELEPLHTFFIYYIAVTLVILIHVFSISIQ